MSEPQETGHGVVASIAPASLAARVGIQPGDEIISVNGHAVRDVIDWQFYTAEEKLEIVLQRGDREMLLDAARDYDETVGVEFSEPTFDGIRRCQCRCTFCFVQQMAPGLRCTLYVRDDDYRYSFLFGNFITLTNLTRADWRRLEEQRLSPLYISVHATDLELRRKLMGNPAAPDILAQLKALQNLGITAHTQIVLTPGLNDEAALTQTITDLAALYPTVESIGIVPVGLTRFHRRGLRSLTSAEAAALIERIQAHQAHFRREHGVNLVYLSDEIYLLAERPIPSAEEYDDFRQLENGIGLTRQLLDEWEELRPTLTGFRPAYKHATLACGALIAPVLARIAAELSAITGASFQVTPIPSRLFGASVTVSGLLVGEDILFALRRRDLGDVVFLPRAMFDAAGERTLDELTPEELEQQLGVRVRVAGTIEELLA